MKLQTLVTLTLVLIATSFVTAQKIKPISSSCGLAGKAGDTLIVKGSFNRCMEYSGFQTIKRDSCSSDYQMELNLKNIPENKKLTDNFKKLSKYGCGGSFELTLKGIIIDQSEDGYGHLGSSDVEFLTLDVIRIGKVKYSKLE
jgi:hypothetical protein